MVKMTILTQRFFEDAADTEAGVITYHHEETDVRDDTNIEDAITMIRAHGLTFDNGDGLIATEPDGSNIIDYATAERETVTIFIDPSKDWEIAAIIAGVDYERELRKLGLHL